MTPHAVTYDRAVTTCPRKGSELAAGRCVQFQRREGCAAGCPHAVRVTGLRPLVEQRPPETKRYRYKAIEQRDEKIVAFVAERPETTSDDIARRFGRSRARAAELLFGLATEGRLRKKSRNHPHGWRIYHYTAGGTP